MLLLPIYTDDAVETVGGRNSIAVILFVAAEPAESHCQIGNRRKKTACLTAKVRQVDDWVLHFFWISPRIAKRTCG